MDKVSISLNLDQLDTLVSILNLVYEQNGGDVDESGFGYTLKPETNTCDVLMADGDSFEDGIEYLWDMIKD